MKNNLQKVYPNQWKRAEGVLKNGGVVIAPTDTLYGILGSAHSKEAVERIYSIKGRDKGKPCIILISSLEDLKKFGIKLSRESYQYKFLTHIWPNKVSIVLPCPRPTLNYLHRGTKALAFRMISPKNKNLYTLIEQVGPLVAPSANPAGSEPAKTIREAKIYFQESVDLYVNSGSRNTSASTLVSLLGPKPKILRQGVVTI